MEKSLESQLGASINFSTRRQGGVYKWVIRWCVAAITILTLLFILTADGGWLPDVSRALALPCVVLLPIFSTSSACHGAQESDFGQALSAYRVNSPLEDSRKMEATHFQGTREAAEQITNTCPRWFSFILKDLEPWARRGGISQAAIDRAVKLELVNFRIKIVNQKLYSKRYREYFQTREEFTLLGLLHLLNRYPGQIPDVDIAFKSSDFPVVARGFHATSGSDEQNAEGWDRPLVVTYCSSAYHLDVVWPDWSFWGWPETRIREWNSSRDSIMKGPTATIPWEEKIPMAHWKGTTWVNKGLREPIVACADPPSHGWRVESYNTEWGSEVDSNSTRLELQCRHRFKIYAEGGAWSVSLKYILACTSTSIFIDPQFFDFFSRGLEDGIHFIGVQHPMVADRFCEQLKAVVEDGNRHREDSKAVAEAAKRFLVQELSMERVYDYMLHLLRHYHRLQRFQPRAPSSSSTSPDTEMELVTLESLRSRFQGNNVILDFMSFHVPEASEPPCTMDPP